MSASAVALAVLPLVGVLVGAGLQFFSARFLETGKQLSNLRAAAYTDYFRAAFVLSTQGRTPDGLAALGDAKSRVCLYGSARVVEALSEFEKAGADLREATVRKSLTRFVSEARKETAGNAAADR